MDYCENKLETPTAMIFKIFTEKNQKLLTRQISSWQQSAKLPRPPSKTEYILQYIPEETKSQSNTKNYTWH